eukprot:scaffold75043_cov48-Prasinocladus_malaysianus.AAC.3
MAHVASVYTNIYIASIHHSEQDCIQLLDFKKIEDLGIVPPTVYIGGKLGDIKTKQNAHTLLVWSSSPGSIPSQINVEIDAAIVA